MSRSADGPALAWWRAAAVGAGALVLALGLLLGAWLLARPLALLIAAIAIAQAVAPGVERLQRWMPRPLAVVLVYLALIATLAGVGWLVGPRLASQATALADEAPGLIGRGRRLIDGWDPATQDRIVSTLEGTIGRFSNLLVMLPLGIVSSLTVIVLVFFMSAYWLIAQPDLNRFVRSLVAPEQRDRYDAVVGELGATVGGYVRGEAITGLIVGTLVYVGLTIIGVNYALVLALIAALGEFIPVVGPILAAIPAVIVAFLHSPTQALIVLIFYVALQQLESNVILPNVVNQQANVPPLLALIALFAGAELMGILGAIVAIPVAGGMRVLVVNLVAPAVRRWTGAARAGGPVSRAAGNGDRHRPDRGTIVVRRGVPIVRRQRVARRGGLRTGGRQDGALARAGRGGDLVRGPGRG